MILKINQISIYLNKLRYKYFCRTIYITEEICHHLNEQVRNPPNYYHDTSPSFVVAYSNLSKTTKKHACLSLGLISLRTVVKNN